MNNNLLFTMLAASTMMLATGCSSSDDTVATQESNLATVSFSVQADAVVGTRAISDGTGADELIYRVFDKEGHVISASLAKKTETGLTDLSTWPRARPTRWPSGHRMPTARHIPSMTTWA